MATKQLMFEEKAWGAIRSGVTKLADAVKVTLGPTGRNVVLQKSWGSPRVTKDGVTVSKEIELPHAFENMGAKMVNEVASKTSDQAGDGTTTAVVLAEAIFKEGLRNVTAGASPISIKRGIDRAVEIAVRQIAKQSIKIKDRGDVAKVGTISANGEPPTRTWRHIDRAEAERHLRYVLSHDLAYDGVVREEEEALGISRAFLALFSKAATCFTNHDIDERGAPGSGHPILNSTFEGGVGVVDGQRAGLLFVTGDD